jgi:amino acid transporter
MLMLYRKIEWVGRLMVALWVGVILTIAVVLISGLRYFDAGQVLDFPPEAFTLSPKFFLGLGSAMSLAMYSFLGYFSVCNVGEEVRKPTRTIPWSILISVLLVAVIYLAMNISIISVIPWRRATQEKEFIASVFMEGLYGPLGGQIMTVLICWTAFASVFALMLGYSRIPFAAARDGFFFSPFARLHPRGEFPYVSLLVLGGVTMATSFLPLEAVIQTLLTARILVQFIAQIGAVALLRHRETNPATFRMVGYPLPSVVALVGWGFIFWTSENIYISGSLLILNLGMVAFLAWSWLSSRRSPI